MRIPAIRGVIERRLLINFRVDADVLSSVVPDPFEPLLVDGFGVAGICMIRLGHLRPAAIPGTWGVGSENAAHRVAVRLPNGDDGVYIPRRDTNSRLNILLGGRLFPGVHHHATFNSLESEDRIEVVMSSDDGETHVEVAGNPTDGLQEGSVFRDLKTASSFFERGALGYSDTSEAHRFDALELRARNWSVSPLIVDRVVSSFFANEDRFPTGSIEFDNALLMRNIDHEWHAHESLRATPSARV
jgi:hypothetical protein